MAKARRPAKKGRTKSSRPKTAKKAVKAVKVKKAVKAKKTRKAAAQPARTIELKKLRDQFSVVLAALSTRQSASLDVESRLDDARRRISQWMTDVDDICSPDMQEICGPDMAFPVP